MFMAFGLEPGHRILLENILVTIFAGPFSFPIAMNPVDMQIVLLYHAASANHAGRKGSYIINKTNHN
jgi:hypothetical protein